MATWMIRLSDIVSIPVYNQQLSSGKGTELWTCVFLDLRRLTDKEG